MSDGSAGSVGSASCGVASSKRTSVVFLEAEIPPLAVPDFLSRPINAFSPRQWCVFEAVYTMRTKRWRPSRDGQASVHRNGGAGTQGSGAAKPHGYFFFFGAAAFLGAAFFAGLALFLVAFFGAARLALLFFALREEAAAARFTAFLVLDFFALDFLAFDFFALLFFAFAVDHSVQWALQLMRVA